MASESSQTRRALLDRLERMGNPVGPLALERLPDASWFVQRNMLALLRAIPERPPQFDARPFAAHADARVRREALRLLFTIPTARDHAICQALADPDSKNAQLGLNAAHDGCPEPAVPLVASLAARGDSVDQRVAAIRALGAAPSPAAVTALLAIVTPRKSGFWRKKPTVSPEYRAAVTALKARASDPQARAALERLGEG